jgi:hypothetical protein
LVAVSWRTDAGRRRGVSPVELDEWRAAARSFTGLAAYSRGAVNVSDDRAAPAQIEGAWVTANLFDLLRVSPVAGRGLLAADDRPGAEPVVLIGDELWRDRFGRDPSAVGATLRVDGRPATIVGVMPAGMGFPENSNLWTIYAPTDAQKTRTNRSLTVLGRMAPAASRESADAEMRAIAERLRTDHADEMKDLSGVTVETLVQRFLGGAARPMFITVMGAVMLVLFIACVNVANLMLARSIHRAREIAVRVSIGATRWRVVRQLLVESVLLSIVGGVVGLGLASIGVRRTGSSSPSTTACWPTSRASVWPRASSSGWRPPCGSRGRTRSTCSKTAAAVRSATGARSGLRADSSSPSCPWPWSCCAAQG